MPHYCCKSGILFFFNEPATTEIYTLSLHDALPISELSTFSPDAAERPSGGTEKSVCRLRDRKSTRLNSSHGYISYAVFGLKKQKDAHRGSPKLLTIRRGDLAGEL